MDDEKHAAKRQRMGDACAATVPSVRCSDSNSRPATSPAFGGRKSKCGLVYQSLKHTAHKSEPAKEETCERDNVIDFSEQKDGDYAQGPHEQSLGFPHGSFAVEMDIAEAVNHEVEYFRGRIMGLISGGYWVPWPDASSTDQLGLTTPVSDEGAYPIIDCDDPNQWSDSGGARQPSAHDADGIVPSLQSTTTDRTSTRSLGTITACVAVDYRGESGDKAVRSTQGLASASRHDSGADEDNQFRETVTDKFKTGDCSPDSVAIMRCMIQLQVLCAGMAELAHALRTPATTQ